MIPIRRRPVALALAGLAAFAAAAAAAVRPEAPPAPPPPAAAGELFQPLDVFQLEWAADPQISPDGSRVVYVRNRMDVMTDRPRSELWIVGADGSGHRPLVSADEDASSPRWSPDGKRLLYVASDGDSPQLAVRWMDTGQTAIVTHVAESPSGIAWSPDGAWIAFSMRVPGEPEKLVELPAKPEGAEWAEPPIVIEELIYRLDGAGYVEQGHDQLFVVPADGGTPRQVTAGAFDHGGRPSWTADGKALVFAANRHEDYRYEPLETEIYEVRLADGVVRQLTERGGPDAGAVVSPDGSRIAYVGFDDRFQGYQATRLYVMDRDGSNPRALTADLDRDAGSPVWSADGKRVFIEYDEEGDTKVAAVALEGKVTLVAERLGGTSLGRPYSGGSFSVARDGSVAYTLVGSDHPADVGLVRPGDSRQPRRLTALNADLLAHRELGEVEEIWYPSSHDQRRVQGWIVKPPGFDPQRKYPLLLEIHGGPFANYGPRFAAEIQLYAARGYVVLYTNPRGSTSYGEEFGNLIHHAYPGNDYDDLISGVDAVIAKGYVDPERLYVTGGSGGGVLTAWIVGKTDRFRAAAVQKPVINWTSFALTADFYNFFHKYWFAALPWEDPDAYWARSPLSLVGNVSTPTLVLTGEQDHRTPISESEQLYQALKLRKVETALVRMPGAAHDISARPSQLVGKTLAILGWFERYGGPAAPGETGGAAAPAGAPGSPGRAAPPETD